MPPAMAAKITVILQHSRTTLTSVGTATFTRTLSLCSTTTYTVKTFSN